jgi:hypothetical protein
VIGYVVVMCAVALSISGAVVAFVLRGSHSRDDDFNAHHQ